MQKFTLHEKDDLFIPRHGGAHYLTVAALLLIVGAAYAATVYVVWLQ